MFYRVIWPARYLATSERILEMARDAEADNEIEGGFGDDADEAVRQLSDAGIITVAN
jgi:hypothetical protein